MESEKHPHSGPVDESPMRTPMGVSPAAAGLTPQSSDAAVEPEGDVESNELHAGVGTACHRCGQKILAGEEVRRTARGDFQHENCPPA